MSRRTRVAAIGTVAVAALALTLVATFQAAIPFVSPSELTPDLEGRRVQVEGLIGSINVETDHLVLELLDELGATALVRYPHTGRRPLALEEGRLVVAKGTFLDGVVEADQVSVRAHEPPGSE